MRTLAIPGMRDHAIGDHVRLIATPGHTPGHMAVALGKGSDEAVATGEHWYGRRAIELGLPLVSVIDTTGGALSKEAEERGLGKMDFASLRTVTAAL